VTARTATIATLSGAVCVLGSAGTAVAGEYNVYSCRAGAESYLNPGASGEAWSGLGVRSAGGHVYYDTADSCAGGGALTVGSSGNLEAPNGLYAELRFGTPEGTQLVRVQLSRAVYTYGVGTGTSARRSFVRAVLDPFGPAGIDDYSGASDVSIASSSVDLDLSTRPSNSFAYRVGCERAPCPTSGHYPGAPGAPDTLVRLFASVVTLRDSSPPSMSVSRTGLLADEGIKSGVAPVTVRLAHDNSGIRRLAVHADGGADPIAAVDFTQDQNHCSWARRVPCTSAKEVDMPVDTRSLSDGDHTFTVKAYDAALNVHDHVHAPVTIRNGAAEPPPAGPGTPAAGSPTRRPSGGSTGGSRDGGSSGRGAGEPGAVGATEQNGVRASRRARLELRLPRRSRGRLRVRFSRRPVLRGRLVDERGRGIGSAQIELTGRTVGLRARALDLGSVRTDRDGRFKLVLPARQSSRTLRLAYRPSLGDGREAAVASVRINVVAGVFVKASPRAVRNGQTVTFTGRLLGGPVPRSGKLIDMQVLIGRSWRTFAIPRTRPDGTFTHRYRFTRTIGPVRYRFRALSRYEVAYPYGRGASERVSVLVR
jgi:hypothetical protein